MQIISNTLAKTTIGDAVVHMNLAMYPLLAVTGPEPDYLTLEQALATGQVRVTEVSAHGSVPELRFENGCDRPVLLLDGEELVGAKQNRMLNLSILVPAKSTIEIPVSCVEAGRWHSVSHEFRSAERAQYSRVRSRKMADVSMSMRDRGSRHSNQSGVWDDIADKMDSVGVSSATSAADEIYQQHEHSVEEFVAAITSAPQQVGFVFAINGRLAGLDLFDHAQTLERMLPKLVRSYAMDAISNKQAEQPLSSAAVDRLLGDVARARIETFNAVGLGEDLRLTGRIAHGAALAVDDRIVHLCAFTTTNGSSGPGRSRYAPASVRRRFH